jgi:pimeloyl-ACP methyl ester carboxylesterase
LHCWFYRVSGSNKLAIVSHGNAGNIANRVYLAKVLTDAHCSVLLYDYRGFGLSGGIASIDGILQDGLTVYDYAHLQLGYPTEKIILVSESVGSAVALNLACQRKCAAIILESGMSSLPAVGKNLFKFLYLFPDFILAKPHLDNLSSVRSIHVPILFIHGKRDTLVPYQHSVQMFLNAQHPKYLVLLPNCGHNDMGVYDSAAFQGAIAKFIQSIK